mgnify:CR=1 FL=1
MSPKPDLAASAILLQRDIKTVSCPVTGISPCRCSDSSCYRHSIMMLCQYVKRKKEDRIVSMGVSHDKLQKCRDPVKMIRYRQTAFLYSSGTALDRRGGNVFVAGNQLLMDVIDLIVNPPRAVISEGVECDVRHIGTQCAVTLRQTRRDGPRRGQQRQLRCH